MKCVIFTLFLMIAMVMADDQCSPWLDYCQITDQCCRHLICSGYTAKCVPKGGLVMPGEDKRPLGPGPYPPNVPESELQ
ncbi:U-reduvitoxin-Pr4a-like [Linepithema humile]|uniref:U-reduvitoxin-Pr4a-like n=1 Tax=Linepithema humile TaxID=83485 RepID=UPI00351DA9C6